MSITYTKTLILPVTLHSIFAHRLPVTENQVSPVNLAAAAIAKHNRPPEHIISALTFYLLTLNKDWVKGIEVLEVELDYRKDGAFSVKVKDMGEYLTYSD